MALRFYYGWQISCPQMGTAETFPLGKTARALSWLSPTAEVSNEWTFTPTTPYYVRINRTAQSATGFANDYPN